jgi:hypothetical protein
MWKYEATKIRMGERLRRHWHEDSKFGTEAEMSNP